ncbi:MAG: hypothetical protein ABSD71_14990 [Bacteroidales bacterium]|jgi:predicted anti-sigma-YlaC factor YlaD
MKCSDAIALLERMIFEKIKIDDELRQHIDTCSSCRMVYQDALKAREVLYRIRHSEPMLRDPGEFTDNILSAIRQSSQRTPVVLMFLQRMLAAAAVAILILFAYEQYGVIRKISGLEKHFSEIKTDFRSSYPLQLTSTIDINNAGISFSEIEKLLSTLKGSPSLLSSSLKKRLDQNKIK